jgi:myo-inositol 2-dehydrogenase / D-chiro-inositol 1-dehydrogenase
MTNERPVYRVALLSNAMHQERFAQAFAQHPRLRVVSVVDEPGIEPYIARRNRALAEEHGVPYVESLDAAGGDDVDVVSVGAEIERRGRLALAAAGWGKHLWLDKPPAASVAETDELAATVRASGVRSLVFSHLAAPWSVALQEAINRGEVGSLRAVHLDFSFVKGMANGLVGRRVPAGTGARDVWTFRDPDAATDPTESGHHVIAKRELAEEGWYALSLAWRLCPQPVRRVFATGGAYFLEHHRDLNVEDFATLVLTLEDGPLVTIATGRTGRRTHAGTSRMLVRAAGDRGTIVIDGGQPPVHRYSAAGSTGGSSRPAAESTGLAEIVDHFVACLDGVAPSLTTVEDARGLMRVLDAAYKSIATGQPVDCR